LIILISTILRESISTKIPIESTKIQIQAVISNIMICAREWLS
jgi:hypothetical protein